MQDALTKLDKLVKESKGRFFSIRFVKNDGTERVINGKDKYEHLLSGGRSTVRPAGYTSFVDRNANGGIGAWKAAKSDRLIEFRCGEVHESIKVG